MHNQVPTPCYMPFDTLSYGEKVDLVRQYLFNTKQSQVLSTVLWHPYGFLVSKLVALDAVACVRLHIWPPLHRIRQVPHWPVHSHPWSLRSAILCGVLTNEIYEVTTADYRTKNQLYRVNYADAVSILHATDIPLVSRPMVRRDYRSGDEYELEMGQFHATHVADGVFAATLVFSEGVSIDSPGVVGEFGYARTYQYARPRCDPAMLAALLQELETRLK